MDFNTGGGPRRPDDESRPLFGEEAGGPAGGPTRGPVESPTREFNLQDPIPNFIRTVRGLVLDPVGFFRGIARQGDFVSPLVFALICALINGILGGIIAFFVSVGFGTARVGGAFGTLITNIILTPIWAAIFLFIAAAIIHLLVMLLVSPRNSGFEATFRVASYVQVTQLISWIPLIGWIVAPIYSLVLAIIGIREIHDTTTGRAAAIVLIPVVVVILLLVLLAIVVGAALLALFYGAQQ